MITNLLDAAHRSQRLRLIITATGSRPAVVVGMRNGMVSLLSRDDRGNWSTSTVRIDDVIAVAPVPAAAPR